MSYKTLILIDNSKELTTLNQEIIKETVKYYISNCTNDDKVAIAVTGETAEYLTEYDDSLSTQLKTIESLEFSDINAPGGDVLMEVLFDWEKGDFAYRDIIYISGRSVNNMRSYTEEELLFEINNRQYPVYCVACVQEGNEASVKSMNMLSRLSGGVAISTDDAKEDAEVERQLCEKLKSAIDEKRALEEAGYDELSSVETHNGDMNNNDVSNEDTLNKENSIEGTNANKGSELSDGSVPANGNDSNMDEELTVSSEGTASPGVIYENGYQDKKNQLPDFVFYTLVVAGIIVVAVLIKKIISNRIDQKKDAEFKRKLPKNTLDKTSDDYEPFAAARDIENSKREELNTVKLGGISPEDNDTGTRLLYRARDGIEITLEDRADPTKFFRACVNDSVIIGRNEKLCDIAITYDDSISSTHCELYARDSVLYIRDLDSSNGTVVNQHKVYQEIALESGDILRIGRLTFFIQIVRDNSYE